MLSLSIKAKDYDDEAEAMSDYTSTNAEPAGTTLETSTDKALTKSDLIELLARRQSHLAPKDVELAVKGMLEAMSAQLANGERIEIRGFGSFCLHFRDARIGRNPKSGDAVALRGKYVPHFKPGKELRERVNEAGELASSAGSAKHKSAVDDLSDSQPN